MEWSEILNVIFGTGLVATIVGLLSIRSELKKARAAKVTAYRLARDGYIERIKKGLYRKLKLTLN